MNHESEAASEVTCDHGWTLATITNTDRLWTGCGRAVDGLAGLNTVTPVTPG